MINFTWPQHHGFGQQATTTLRGVAQRLINGQNDVIAIISTCSENDFEFYISLGRNNLCLVSSITLSLFRRGIAIAVLPCSRCRRSYVRFRCRFVNMRRNWIETTFHSDERQAAAAQTSILDEAENTD